jgi:hypothetical protein
VAYLLCELVWRLRAVGDSEEDAVRLPMTQTDLADALGLTPVHGPAVEGTPIGSLPRRTPQCGRSNGCQLGA